MRSGRWAERAAASFLLLGGLSHCAGSAEPDGENHACFRALDCADGLVCVEGRCTADLAPIVPEGAGQGAPATGAAGGASMPAGAAGGSSMPEAAGP
jgi:hypothetical protein